MVKIVHIKSVTIINSKFLLPSPCPLCLSVHYYCCLNFQQFRFSSSGVIRIWHMVTYPKELLLVSCTSNYFYDISCNERIPPANIYYISKNVYAAVFINIFFCENNIYFVKKCFHYHTMKPLMICSLLQISSFGTSSS